MAAVDHDDVLGKHDKAHVEDEDGVLPSDRYARRGGLLEL